MPDPDLIAQERHGIPPAFAKFADCVGSPDARSAASMSAGHAAQWEPRRQAGPKYPAPAPEGVAKVAC